MIMIFYNVRCVLAVLPTFDRTNENVTVIIGSAAVLPCFISNLGDHKVSDFLIVKEYIFLNLNTLLFNSYFYNTKKKVAWIKMDYTDVLTIGDNKVTNDDRIKIVHGYVTDWSLSIQPVSEEDSGEYICQINTEPQMTMKINLQVLRKLYTFVA